MLVLAKRSCEVTIALGKKTTAQQQQSSQEIVQDINASIKCKAAITAGQL
jgi:hypothetical protein